MTALLEEHGDELELFCYSKNDEHFLFEFFMEHPEIVQPIKIKCE